MVVSNSYNPKSLLLSLTPSLPSLTTSTPVSSPMCLRTPIVSDPYWSLRTLRDSHFTGTLRQCTVGPFVTIVLLPSPPPCTGPRPV